jgi:hypothetical protein
MRVLDLISAALTGAMLTVLLLGNALNPETHAYARDGVLLILIVTLIARLIVSRRTLVNANG